VATPGSRAVGNIVLDPSIVTDSAKSASISKVEYYIGSKLIYTSSQEPFHLDTSVLGDGTYSITEKVYFKDGRTEEKTAQINIGNNSMTASPTTKKSKAVIAVGITFLVLGIIGLVVLLVPSVRNKVLNFIRGIFGRPIQF
jgi:hypothetical protein